MSGIFVESVGFEFESSAMHPFKKSMHPNRVENLKETDDLEIKLDKNTLSIYQDSPGNIKTLFSDELLRKDIPKFLPKPPHTYPPPDLLNYPREDVNFLDDVKYNLEIEYLIYEGISKKDLNIVISEELPKLYDFLSSSIKLSGYYKTNSRPLIEYTLDGGDDSFKLIFIMSRISNVGIKNIDKAFLYSNFTPQMTIGIKISNIEQTFLKFEEICDNKNINLFNLKSISLLLDELMHYKDDLGGGGLKHLQVTYSKKKVRNLIRNNVIKNLLRNVCFYIIYLYHILKSQFKYTFDEHFDIDEYNDEYIKTLLFFNPRNSIIEIIKYINNTYKINIEILINEILTNISIEFNNFLELLLSNKIKSVDESSALSSNVESPSVMDDGLLSDNFIIRNGIVFFEVRFFSKLFENKTLESILSKQDILIPQRGIKKKHKKKTKGKKHKKKHTKKKKLSTRAPKSTRTPSRVR
jgi:hypothetical protein